MCNVVSLHLQYILYKFHSATDDNTIFSFSLFCSLVMKMARQNKYLFQDSFDLRLHLFEYSRAVVNMKFTFYVCFSMLHSSVSSFKSFSVVKMAFQFFSILNCLQISRTFSFVILLAHLLNATDNMCAGNRRWIFLSYNFLLSAALASTYEHRLEIETKIIICMYFVSKNYDLWFVCWLFLLKSCVDLLLALRHLVSTRFIEEFHPIYSSNAKLVFVWMNYFEIVKLIHFSGFNFTKIVNNSHE